MVNKRIIKLQPAKMNIEQILDLDGSWLKREATAILY